MEEVVSHAKDVEKEVVEAAEGVTRQWLIGEDMDVPCYMRLFTFEKDGKMPLHKHDNMEHLQFYIKGKMRVELEETEYEVGANDFIYVPKDVAHTYENIGNKPAQFICIIPAIKDRHTELVEE